MLILDNIIWVNPTDSYVGEINEKLFQYKKGLFFAVAFLRNQSVKTRVIFSLFCKKGVLRYVLSLEYQWG